MTTIPAGPLDAVTLLVTRTCDTCKHAYSTTLTLDMELESVLERYYAGELEDA
jgi:glutaredoxin